MVIEQYDGLVAGIAYQFSHKFKMVEPADIRQELWVWFLEHPQKVKTWETLEGSQSVKLIARSLRNAAKDYCQKQKAQIIGYRVEDNYYYDRELIEILLPAVLNGNLTAPALTEMGYQATKRVASEGGNWFAMMADIERGVKRLSMDQWEVVDMRFREGSNNAMMAKELDITEDAARMRVNRAMNNLMNYLGGDRPYRERDYTQEEAENEGRRGSDHASVPADTKTTEKQDVEI